MLAEDQQIAAAGRGAGVFGRRGRHGTQREREPGGGAEAGESGWREDYWRGRKRRRLHSEGSRCVRVDSGGESGACDAALGSVSGGGVALAGFAPGGEGGADEMGIHGGDAVKNKAVFLDRDGVLNQAVVRNGKPYPPATASELVLTPNAKSALRELKAQGFFLLVVTNQPDVAKGITTRAAVEEINRKLAAELPLDDVFICSHQDKDHCDCRNRKPGMILEGARNDNEDLPESFMVGAP